MQERSNDLVGRRGRNRARHGPGEILGAGEGEHPVARIEVVAEIAGDRFELGDEVALVRRHVHVGSPPVREAPGPGGPELPLEEGRGKAAV